MGCRKGSFFGCHFENIIMIKWTNAKVDRLGILVNGELSDTLWIANKSENPAILEEVQTKAEL